MRLPAILITIGVICTVVLGFFGVVALRRWAANSVPAGPAPVVDYYKERVLKDLAEADPAVEEFAPDYAAMVGRIVAHLAGEDAAASTRAINELTSLPGGAVANVEQAERDPQTRAAVRAELQRALPALQTRAKLETRRREERLGFYRKLLDAYAKYGDHNPRWDARVPLAVNALAHAGTEFDRTPKQEAQIEQLFEKIINLAQCDDPLILYADGLMLRQFEPEDAGGGTARINWTNALAKLDGSNYPPAWKGVIVADLLELTGSLRQGGTGTGQSNAPDETARFSETIESGLLSPARATAYAKSILEIQPMGLLGEEATVPRDKKADFEAMASVIQKRFGNTIEPLLMRGNFYIAWAWEARGGGTADTVTDQAARLFAERLTLAQAAFGQAYDMDPTDPRPATRMLDALLGSDVGHEAMELWFQRAMKADPDNYESCSIKLRYIQPVWYGSTREMVEFGRWCRGTHNYRGRLPIVLVDALVGQPRYYPVTPADVKDPTVWAEIREVFDPFLALYPDARSVRTRYIILATRGQHWKDANRQYELLGDHPWPVSGYDKTNFDMMRKAAASRKDSPDGL